MTGRTADDTPMHPTLVIKERETGGIWALSGLQKGVHSKHLVTRINKIIDSMGTPHVILKSDQEPAMVSLQQEVRRNRWAEIQQIMEASEAQRETESGGKTTLEFSPAGESQSNGLVERAIQEVQGQVRTLKHRLEERCGIRTTPHNDVWHWMLEYAA